MPNTAIAQEYYDLFQSVIAGNEVVTVNERTKEILPDFSKVAITYSISENEESSIAGNLMRFMSLNGNI